MAESPEIFHEPESLEQKEVIATVKQNWAQRARASNWSFFIQIVALIIQIVAVVGTAVGLIIAYLQFVEQAKDNRNATNWMLLTTPAPGNSGKVEAMQYLASKRQPLDGIDLSCEAMGGVGPNERGEEVCVRPTYLGSLNLSKATHGWKVSLTGANLSGANLRLANLSGASLKFANLSGANLLSANLSDANLEHANLSGADLALADLSGANLSYAEFKDAVY